VGLTFWATHLQNPTPGIRVMEGGNTFRWPTRALVPQAKLRHCAEGCLVSLAWGVSSAAYTATCGAGFGHVRFHGMLCVNRTLNVLLILCVWFTLDVSYLLLVTHFIRVACMQHVLLLSHVSLMLTVAHFIRVSCTLYVACMLPTHVPHAAYCHSSCMCRVYLLTHWGQVMQICVFTLQLRKTDDANLRF
jgi:hypothetical protein